MTTNSPSNGSGRSPTWTSIRPRTSRSSVRLLQPFIRFCEYFNTDDPETDASLLFGTITRLEYASLPAVPDNVDYRAIRNEIRRIVGWIVRSN